MTRHAKQLKRLDAILKDLQKDARKNIDLIKAVAELGGKIERKEFD